jgi:polar amino acid transport system substrate-binding protein
VISGTTITSERSAIALFSQPYLEFNQGVAVNRRLIPNVSRVAYLRGLTAGIQTGNTSDFVARRLRAEGVIAGIKYYAYHGIAAALDDLATGRIGLVIKLFPVISWLVKDHPQLTVAMQVPTHEKLGIAFAKDNESLCEAVNHALTTLHDNGRFAELQARWFPASFSVRSMLHAFKLYTGPDNASHVLEGVIAQNDRSDVVAIHFK